MKGYKGTDKNMMCRGTRFKIGETFEIVGKPELCRNGFHFCLNLPDVFRYYWFGGNNRYFEVEAEDNVTVIGDDKCVTTRIRIVRELSNKEVSRAIYGNGHGDGDEYEYGYGYGNGDGDGDGDGNKYGHGYGDGDEYGYGYGYGNGDGDGDGDGNKYGHGYGNEIINSILIWR